MLKIASSYGELSGGNWFKGNLHTHTNRSDGRRTPQAVLDDYAGRKYDFLMLSDHDVFTSEKDFSDYDVHEMVMIPGNEVTSNGPHVLHVNASRLIAPNPQRQIVMSEAAKNDPQSFVIACHPNWQSAFDHTSLKQLEEWVGYTGMEIFNGTIGRLEGSPYATNKWDMLLSQGRVCGDTRMTTAIFRLSMSAWAGNMVYAKTRTRSDIIDALRNGRFYASTGVTIRNLSVTETTIRIETENAERIVALRDVGRRIGQTDGTTFEVEVPPEAKYVRVRVLGTRRELS